MIEGLGNAWTRRLGRGVTARTRDVNVNIIPDERGRPVRKIGRGRKEGKEDRSESAGESVTGEFYLRDRFYI